MPFNLFSIYATLDKGCKQTADADRSNQNGEVSAIALREDRKLFKKKFRRKELEEQSCM